MKKLNPKTRTRIVILVLAMIAVAVGSSFSLVWLQQQITQSARSSQKLEADYTEILRKLRFVDERIASYHQPAMLQGRVAGTLRPSLDNQIVWVRESPTPSGRAYAATLPYETTMDLALSRLTPQRAD